jgi:prepilin-type processing-associated H-X9-DG protein
MVRVAPAAARRIVGGDQGKQKPTAFTLIELLVALGIIALLVGILLPALERAREHANTAACATHLRSVGEALALYANENHGAYPRSVYVAGAPPTAGTAAAAANTFGVGGPAPNDVTAALWLLVRTQNFPPALFACPYNDVTTWEPDTAADPSGRSNVTDYRRNLGYSYANPYPDAAAAAAGYRLGPGRGAAFAVMADVNPGTGAASNSRNHDGDGQNVLYGDGHVQWQTGPNVGAAGDNIYTNRGGAVAASPADASDSVLLPGEN